MKIILTQKEALEYFHNALCNGMDYITGHGIAITWNKREYQEARKDLKLACHEDVLIQILKDGGRLYLQDYEGDEERVSIILQDVYNRVGNTPIEHLSDMINGQDDAITSDVIIQTVFLQDIIYG